MAKIKAMDDGFEYQAAKREKALANEANKQERATARVKALADELRQAATLERALTDEANEQRRADTLRKALADKAKERHEAVAHDKALAAKVLAAKLGGQELAVRGKPRKTVRRRANLVFVLVSVMAHEPPIHRSTFFAVGDIGHERPTNLLSVDELRWWIVIWFVFGFQFFRNSVGRPVS